MHRDGLKQWKQFAFLALLATLGACSSSSNSDSRGLRFGQDVTVATLDGRETSYKSGDSIPMPSDPAKVEAPGYVSLLLVPSGSGRGQSEVKLRKMDQWGGSELDREVNLRLGKVIERIISIQKQLAKRDGREALRLVQDLQNEYPGLTYLDFLKASALVLMGDRSGARAAVENALASFPDNPTGRALLNSLGGGSK